ncbi:MAG: hypothetical protein K8J08_18295 [Thermoanaerobaculia bacterium]|nr:hypothetical protein [Thermoanaerobaculia bacterium]
MQAALRIVDENATGDVLAEASLRLVSERVTVGDIISARVRQEATDFNKAQDGQVFRGLVQPTDTERHLNGYRLKKAKVVDPEVQIVKALEAFGQNGFLVLVDDRQVESLDEEIVVTRTSKVSFIKLVPLVGG